MKPNAADILLEALARHLTNDDLYNLVHNLDIARVADRSVVDGNEFLEKLQAYTNALLVEEGEVDPPRQSQCTTPLECFGGNHTRGCPDYVVDSDDLLP